MANEANSGAATEPQQITVAQLAAQLSKKASPAGTHGQDARATTADLGARPAEEAPAGGTPGTEPDLLQPASTEDGAETHGQDARATTEPGEGGEETEPAAPEWYQKRIAKITAKQKALEERLVAAEQRAETAAAELDKARKTGGGSQTKAWNHQEHALQQDLSQKREVLRWAEENADGATITDEKGNEVTYTPEQVRAIKLSALEDIGDLRSQLREHQQVLAQNREHYDAEAVKAYPALADPNSELSRNVETVLSKLPWLREVPDARMSMADMFAGRAARLKKPATTTAGTIAPAKATPRAPGAAGTAPARVAEGEPSEEVKQADKAFFESGRVSDLARRFAAQRKV